MLRQHFEVEKFNTLPKRTAKLLCVAIANQQFETVIKSAEEEGKQKLGGGVARFDGVHAVAITDKSSGNQASPDSVIADIVDALPHCLERTNNLTADAELDESNAFDTGARAFILLSAEHGLRDLWQQILWERWKLTNDKVFKHSPTNRQLAALWIAWTRRQESISGQGALLDGINDQELKRKGKYDKEPFLSKTVVGIGKGKGNHERRFKFGDQAAQTRTQMRYSSEQTVLDECYLSEFLESPLPVLGEQKITCNDLQRAWCVLNDAANILKTKINAKKIATDESINQFSLMIEKSELQRSITECCSYSDEKSAAIISFLSITTADLSEMFNDGFWSRPLLDVDGQYCAIVFPSLHIGNPIRRMEHWLNRGGLSDNLSDVGRGGSFESKVRKELATALKKNALLKNSVCAENSTPSTRHSEQIDLLLDRKSVV